LCNCFNKIFYLFIYLFIYYFCCGKGKDSNGRTAVLYACANKNNLAVVQVLVRHGCDCTVRLRSGTSAMHEAAKQDNQKMVMLLLQEGAGAENERNSVGLTAVDLNPDLFSKVEQQHLILLLTIIFVFLAVHLVVPPKRHSRVPQVPEEDRPRDEHPQQSQTHQYRHSHRRSQQSLHVQIRKINLSDPFLTPPLQLKFPKIACTTSVYFHMFQSEQQKQLQE